MIQELLERVRRISDSMREGGSGTVWYRGHRKTEWPLTSTLHRYMQRLTEQVEKPWPAQEMKDTLREEAKSVYRRFQSEAWPLLSDPERSDWGVLFAMQHYGLPTRLLDWTESFACALFFAQQHRDRPDAAAIWVLDPERLNEVTIGRRGIVALEQNIVGGVVNDAQWHPKYPPPPEDLRTIAVSPVFTNPRMTAQRSVFTLAGDSFQSLHEQQNGRLVSDGILVKIELPPESFDEIEQYLELNGLRAFTYFPDLQGLAVDHEARVRATLRDMHRFLPGLLRKPKKPTTCSPKGSGR